MAWENHLNADCAVVSCRGSFFSLFIHPLHRREKKRESMGHVYMEVAVTWANVNAYYAIGFKFDNFFLFKSSWLTTLEHFVNAGIFRLRRFYKER